MGLTGDLLAKYEGQWHSMTNHKFIASCADASISDAEFFRWMQQDYLYVSGLTGYAGLLVGRAPLELTGNLGQSIVVLNDELDLFRSMAADLGVDVEGAAISPTCFNYLQFLKAVAYEESFLNALTVYWALEQAYLDSWMIVRKKLPREVSWQPFVERWTNDGFRAWVDWLAGCVDTLATAQAVADKARTEELFLRTVQYEYMFWDLAINGESWPLD